VIALSLVTTVLINTGRARYAPLTLLPMLFVASTTLTAGTQMVAFTFPQMIKDGKVATGVLNTALTVFVVVCVALLLLIAVSRWALVLSGVEKLDPKKTT
jgi:carbon starvation protein